MRKMPCLFQRDFTNKRRPILLPTITPGCEWVLKGEGTPTRKRDGTACLVRSGRLYRRYDCKKGKTPPVGFEPCDSEPDAVTGHWPGWIEVAGGPEDRWHMEAWTGLRASDGTRFRSKADLEDGTYELCGPRINGNPEGFDEHVFLRHGAEIVQILPIDVNKLIAGDWNGDLGLLGGFLRTFEGEGIVWHHPDGRMCKLRRDDYGYPWPIQGHR